MDIAEGLGIDAVSTLLHLIGAVLKGPLLAEERSLLLTGVFALLHRTDKGIDRSRLNCRLESAGRCIVLRIEGEYDIVCSIGSNDCSALRSDNIGAVLHNLVHNKVGSLQIDVLERLGVLAVISLHHVIGGDCSIPLGTEEAGLFCSIIRSVRHNTRNRISISRFSSCYLIGSYLEANLCLRPISRTNRRRCYDNVLVSSQLTCNHDKIQTLIYLCERWSIRESATIARSILDGTFIKSLHSNLVERTVPAIHCCVKSQKLSLSLSIKEKFKIGIHRTVGVSSHL